jgi:HPt (histidine-containing phosphotransfer) domain-containing protein
MKTRAAPSLTCRPRSMPELEGHAGPIDLDAALEYAGGDAAFLRELLSVFLEDARGKLAAIRTAFAEGRPADVMAGAHTLKGSLHVLGATSAALLAEKIELAARASRLAGLELELRQFEEQMARVLRWMESHLAAADGA